MEKGFFATLFLATLAVQRCVAARNNERYSSATEYMKHLYEEGAYPDGLPRNDDGESFSVWCLVDTDILQGNYRERPQSTDTCTSVTRYVFSVSQLAQEDGSPISIKKAMLRAYLQVAPKVDSVPIRASITITARLFGSSSDMTTEGKNVGFLPDIDLTPGWMEIEIDANEIRSLFHRHSIQSDDSLEFLLYLQAAGCNTMRVPASFADPAGFRSPKKRQRSLGLQPFLLVFSDDEMTGLRLSKLDSEVSKSKRSADQRSSPTDICQRQEYIINFEDAGLDWILLPKEVDIGFCSGLCPNLLYHMTQRAHLLRLLQSQDIGSDDTSGIGISSEPAHCSPTAYQPLDILYRTDEGRILITRLYDVIVENCYCRN